MTSFWPDVRVRELASEELEPFGTPDRMFFNVNSPDDYAGALGPAAR